MRRAMIRPIINSENTLRIIAPERNHRLEIATPILITLMHILLPQRIHLTRAEKLGCLTPSESKTRNKCSRSTLTLDGDGAMFSPWVKSNLRRKRPLIGNLCPNQLYFQ